MSKHYNPIRLKLSRLFVPKHDSPRNVVPCSLQKAKTVGLMFAISSDADMANANYVFSKLNEMNLNVTTLGYVVNKGDLAKYQQQSYFNLLTDKDLNFLYRPKTEFAIEFEKQRFDIVIDINSVDYYPMQVVLQKLQAGFLVGRFSENYPFDLMMSIDNNDVKYYLEQVMFYLQKFN